MYMFTGIITDTGIVSKASRTRLSFSARPRLIRALMQGGSIAVDGACLTVVAKGKNSFSTDIMDETIQRTNLGYLKAGCGVNLELPATATSFLSGHIVQGHVDGVGTVERIQKKSADHVLAIGIAPALTRCIVPKGSVTVNGISLTVIGVGKKNFSVGIIPHTWGTTMLRDLARGAPVNVEVDVLAKYIEKLIKKRKI